MPVVGADAGYVPAKGGEQSDGGINSQRRHGHLFGEQCPSCQIRDHELAVTERTDKH